MAARNLVEFAAILSLEVIPHLRPGSFKEIRSIFVSTSILITLNLVLCREVPPMPQMR